MRLINSLRDRVSRLLTAPKEELGSWARLVQLQMHLWRFCAGQLRANNAMAMSSALSFRTIFALIPILMLALVTMKSLGIVEHQKQLLRDFLTESGLAQISYAPSEQTQPASGSAGADQQRRIDLGEKIESFLADVEAQFTVGRLGPIGVILMIWTAVTLLTTMERSLNRIFQAAKSRPLGRRILLYWSAITLGPLALLAAGYAGDQVATVAHGWPFVDEALSLIGRVGPVLVGVGLLAMLYKLMPNTHVRFRAALGAAVVAVPVWLLARWGFSFYVARVGRQSIYGAMTIVPLFMIWLNLSWYIFLFGAELAHTAANLARMQSDELGKSRVFGPWDLLATVMAIATAGRAGKGPAAIDQIAKLLSLPERAVENLLARLCDEGAVCRVADDSAGKYLLAQPADSLLVLTILRMGSHLGDRQQSQRCDRKIAEALNRARSRSESGIEQLTVAQLIDES